MPSTLSHIKLCSLIGLSILIMFMSGCVGNTVPNPSPTAETDTPTPEAVHTQLTPTQTQVNVPTATPSPFNKYDLTMTAEEVARVAATGTWYAESFPTLQAEAMTGVARNMDIYETAQAEYEDIMAIFPLEWPVQPFTEEQIIEAQACEFHTLLATRYPERLEMAYLPGAFTPQTACDWAVLAGAYGQHTPIGQPIPQAGNDAFAQAINLNPAFILGNTAVDYYFGMRPIVTSPSLADVPIDSLLINYSYEEYSGEGRLRTEYMILVTDGSTTPFASTFISWPDGEITSFTGHPDRDSVQILRQGLTDLIPIEQPFEISRCSDTGWDLLYWEVIIFWTDGTAIEFTNNGSRLLVGGGPWYTVIDGQAYMQYSPAFLDSLAVLTAELGLSDLSVDSSIQRLEACEQRYYQHNFLEDAFPGLVEEE